MLLGIKRIYDKPSIIDGKRVLVDGLWPRGVKKSTANVDLWMEDVAPSEGLRKWFSHDPAKWDGFKKKYEKELEKNPAFKQLADMVAKSDVTLLYASSDTEHNNAVVLAGMLNKKVHK